jgi:hypothetical protein
MMRRHGLLPLLALAVTGFAPLPFPKDDRPAAEVRSVRDLEGLWVVDRHREGGVVHGGPGQTWLTVRITGGKWSQSCRVEGRELWTTPYVVIIDPKKPGLIDMAYEGAKEPLLWGSFRLDAGRLTVTHTTHGPRPTSHNGELVGSQVRWELRRVKR